MINIDLIIEWIITFFEGFILILTTIYIVGEKYAFLRKRLPYLLLSCTIYFGGITLLNVCIGLFSFFTAYIGIVLLCVASSVVTSKDWITRAMAATLSYFFLAILDYSLGFSVALIIGKSSSIYEGFHLVMNSGKIRIIYLFLNKFIHLFLIYILRSFLYKLRGLNHFYQIVITSISLIAFFVSSLLLNMILSESQIISQTSIILSWCFILICVFALIALCCTNMQLSNERLDNAMIKTQNVILKDSYMQIADKIEELHKQSHDYKNQLLTIRYLDTENVDEYIDSVIRANHSVKSLCRTGDRYVDAVLNCKMEEASIHDIEFSYTSSFPKPLSIDAVDICAILSNQLDNAIEACCKMDNTAQRWIRITLDQKMDFTVFIVENSIAENSIDPKEPLVSSKTDTSRVHGLGIKNIQKAAEKYNGTLSNTVTENSFKSTALMQVR